MDIGVDTPQEPDSAIPKVAARPRFDAIELGSTLRETRIALGHDLGEVADDLRIRNVYLQAIEEGRLGDLPGHAYATGFLRAYGDYLGLDGGDIVARYKASGGAAAGQTDLHLPSPVEEGRLPTASVLVLAALLAVCAYGGWYYMASTGEDPADQVAALPDKIAALVGNEVVPSPSTAEGPATGPAVIGSDPTAAPAPAEDAASTATPAVDEASEPVADRGPVASGAEEGSADADAAPTGETTVAAAPAEPVPTTAPMPAAPKSASVPATAPMPAAPKTASVPTTATLPAAPRTASVPAPVPPPARLPASRREAVAPAPRAAAPEATAMVEPPAADTEADAPAPADVPTASAAASRIVLRANTDSWVEVRADGADPLYSGLLRQGDSYNVPEQPGLTMVTGNAGGIEILVDGKAIPRLGPPGAVRRDVVLDAEALLQTARQ